MMSRFLSAYHAYAGASTDASFEFQHAGALACLSAITIGRRWIPKGANGIHPNLYWLLVAHSTNERKTTSVNLALSVIREVEPERIGPDDFTAESLPFHMRAKKGGKALNKLIIGLGEYGDFLAQSKKSYGAGLMQMLCKLYDGDDIHRWRATSKTIKVEDPHLTMIGACAYGMMEQFVSGDDWSSGFWPRHIFVRSTTRPNIYPVDPPTAYGERAQAIEALSSLKKEIENTPSLIGTTPEAEQMFVDYRASIPEDLKDPTKAAQRERSFKMVWKIALLYQTDQDPQAPIGPVAMHYAIKYVDAAWTNFLYVYDLTACSIFTRFMLKVQAEIAAAGEGGISKRDLFRVFRAKGDTLIKALDLLVRLDSIEIRKIATGGRPSERAYSVAELKDTFSPEVIREIREAIDARQIDEADELPEAPETPESDPEVQH